MRERQREASQAGHVLRYVGRLDGMGQATVGLESVESKHPFANIALTDNIVRFVTDRYADNPLVIRVPARAGGDRRRRLRAICCASPPISAHGSRATT